jgi:hypothetical protein
MHFLDVELAPLRAIWRGDCQSIHRRRIAITREILCKLRLRRGRLLAPGLFAGDEAIDKLVDGARLVAAGVIAGDELKVLGRL